MMTHLAVPWYSQIAPRVTPHQQDRDDFSTVLINIVNNSFLLASIFNKRRTSSFIKFDRKILLGTNLFIKTRAVVTFFRMSILIILI
jgi:hypothetical protein